MQNISFLNKRSGGVDYFQSEKRVIHAQESAVGPVLFAYMKDCITYDLIRQAGLLGRGAFPAAERDYMTPKTVTCHVPVFIRGLDL
ncbi:hypothetical protein QQF64_032404 [Cirrhinus molitorella]|uniref:Uncharacterized protein n=1 Tax=Cirrhinus molitorella TaxID=172907 RepID=A0ABR3MZW4_9TELE